MHLQCKSAETRTYQEFPSAVACRNPKAASLLGNGFGGAGAAAAQGAADTPLAKSVKILNNQLQALTSIEARTAELEARLPQALAAAH